MKWYMRGNLSSMTVIHILKNQSLIIEKMCINHFTITEMDKSTNAKKLIQNKSIFESNYVEKCLFNLR